MVDIFGTLGPACMKEEVLREMFAEGMTGMRLNLSHMMLRDNADRIAMIRRAAADCASAPKILVDLQGPELRIGTMEKPLQLEEGETVFFREEPSPIPRDEKTVPLSCKIIEMLSPGEEFLLDDAKLLARADSIEGGILRATVLRGGMLSSRKSITIADSQASLPALTEADRINIRTAAELGISGVMQPFVRGREDLEEVRATLREAGGENIRIYAKVENLTGVEKIEELIDACDEIVIARGDLGSSMPLWELPRVQKRISEKCRAAGRDFMVVTQMLASMEHAAVPTRAEVSDIYNAVCDGAASVMVTGETAVGEYPVEVIKYLARTANS